MQRDGDRRVRRTRALLHQSLIELIMAKGYTRVTVQDILDHADVGRSTFYSHYNSKDDLLVESGSDHLRAMIAKASASPGDPAAADDDPLLPALLIFRLAGANRQLYQSLIGGRGSAKVVSIAKGMLTEVFTDHLRRARPATDAIELEPTVAFLVNGLMGLLIWWLDTRPDLAPEEVYRRFVHLATCGVLT